MDPVNIYEEIKRLPLRAVVALVCVELAEPVEDVSAQQAPEHPTELPLAA